MKILHNLTNTPKRLIALLVLTVSVTVTVPKLPQNGTPSECSVCSDDDKPEPYPEPTIPKS